MTIQSVTDPALAARIASATPLPGVRAGSALLALGGRLLVIGDDAHAVAWVDPATGATTTQPLDGSGEPLPKMRKPDFEAAAEAPDGSIWIFGSGSLANRRQVVRLTGPAHATVERHDGPALYAALGEHLDGPPNIEGALFVDDALLLCHRAAADRNDVLVEIDPASALTGSPRILRTRQLAAPLVGQVAGHVTDLTRVPDGGLALLAAAEDTPDAVADGPVSGALLGFLSGDVVTWARVTEADGLDITRKPEGLVVDPDGASGWLVTDRDDPRLAAELCRFELIRV